MSQADVQETRRQAEIVMMGACDREALQAERHALATRVAELEGAIGTKLFTFFGCRSALGLLRG